MSNAHASATATALLLSLCWPAMAAAAPQVERADYGVLADGTAVHSYRLSNDHGLSVKVLDLGGILAEVNVPDRRGELRNVTLSLASLQAYATIPTFNALVGRYANRLKDGVSVEGRHFDLTATPNGVTLHGGTAPFGARLWSATSSGSATQAAVTLSLSSPDGDQGFPGELRIQVTFVLTDEDALRIEYQATSDRDTVVNLTHHTYFNLAGNGSGSVYAQRLQVFADAYLPLNADLIPTGRSAPVGGTAFDFREPHAIGARIDSGEPQMLIGRGYDHCFVLRSRPARDGLSPAARLYDPKSGRILEVRTTEPGLQVYSGNLMSGNLLSAAGTALRQGYGLALETEHFPNSPNVPAFPSTLLRAGVTLRSTTALSFSTDRGQKKRSRS